MNRTTELIAECLLAVARGDRPTAHQSAIDAAVSDSSSLLAPALARFLAAKHDGDVYAEPDGFEDFIDNGGNPELYAATIDCLGTEHRSQNPHTYLDIGCGDGRVASAVHHAAELVGFVEPSAALLELAEQRFSSAGVDTKSFNCTIDEMLHTTEATWDLVQSTFALHTLDPAQRGDVLQRLTTRTGRILIVEFDVAQFDDRSPEHAAYAADTFERGLAEYVDLPSVHERFLMPVLIGQFDPDQQRHTHEQSAAAWQRELVDNGWNDVRVSPVADYWWAPAVLLDARVG